MPKIIVKRKSTFIDMTAMSDVTVLLLTFFMLTSTFIQKRTGRGYYSGFRFRNKNTGNEYSFHPGRSVRESIYEHGQTRG